MKTQIPSVMQNVVHQFRVPVPGQDFAQTFVVRKTWDDKLVLNTLIGGTKLRGLGQAPFPSAQDAERWARTTVAVNGYLAS